MLIIQINKPQKYLNNTCYIYYLVVKEMSVYDNKNIIPWIEKYRPTSFEHIVLDPLNRVFFQNIIQYEYFPNLLFYGPPGTGKTTTIINLINEFQKKKSPPQYTSKLHANGKSRENVIHLNASDERGIDIIRIQINQFVKTKNMFDDGYKFVILDEVDYMTKNAQQSLKTLLQLCKQNVRFCLICNYISKIDENLQNEFISVRFNQLPRKEIHQFIRDISDKENIGLDDENILTIQNMYQSDIRSMINFIQLNYICDKKIVPQKPNIDNVNACVSNTIQRNILIINDEVWDIIYCMLGGNKKNEEIIQYIHEMSIQYNIDKQTLLTMYLDYTVQNKSEIIDSKYLDNVENIIHVLDGVPVENILFYFCECFRQKQ